MNTVLKEAKQRLAQKGFLDIEVDPNLDLIAEIKKLKAQKNAIILAHYYQESRRLHRRQPGIVTNSGSYQCRYDCICRRAFYGRDRQNVESAKEGCSPRS